MIVIQQNNLIKPMIVLFVPGVYQGEIFLQLVYNNRIFDEYCISNYGRAYNIRTHKFLNQSPDKDGYLRINIKVDGVFKTVKVHRIMLMTFCPIMYPEKFEGNHKDGIKNNNMLYNLEWATDQDNTRHGWDTGLNTNRGEGNVRSYLKDEDIHFICQNLEKGLRSCEICDLMGIKDKGNRMRIGSIISGILKGKSYRHISNNYNIPGLQGRTRYSLNFAYLVCQFLQEGDKYTYLQIMDLLQIPQHDRKMFKVYINDILRGRTALEVSRNFELKKPREDKIDDFYC